MTGFIDLWHDERLDSTETLGFTLPASDPKIELIVEDAEFEWDGKWWITRQTELERRGAELTLAVEADALWYRLAERTYVGSLSLIDVGAASGLDLILEGSGWARGVRTDSSAAASAVFSFEAQDQSVLSLCRSWAEVCGLFVEFNTSARTVDIVPNRGANLGTAFRYGRNLESIKRRVVPPECTVLYAYGADDLSFAGINGNKAYIEDFTYYTDQGLSLAEARSRYTKVRVIADSKFLTDVSLLAWARTQLALKAQPTIEYQCKVVDLTDLDVPGNEAKVSDTAIVYDGPLGLSVQTTVVRTKKYPLQPWRNEIELSHLDRATNTSSASSGRGASSMQWLMFKHDSIQISMRANGSAQLNRIGIKFREGGEAVYGADINFRGVGTGSVSVSAVDWNAGDPILQHTPLTMPFTDGELIHENITWALKEQQGQKDYRIRARVSTTGGASSASGIDVESIGSRFWILAHGAVQETPTNPTEEIFLFNGSDLGADGSVQKFTVPDGVTEVTAEVMGAAGGDAFGGTVLQPDEGGAGTTVIGTFQVTPGQVLDVYVGGSPGKLGSASAQDGAGWPNGGRGGRARTGNNSTGAGGGGSSHVVAEGLGMEDAWLVGGAGGGQSEARPSGIPGGDSGFAQGQDGGPGAANSPDSAGKGATQYTGGAAGVDYIATDPEDIATSGTFNQGGRAGYFGFFTADLGGGGGGGWYGGGGAGSPDGAGSFDGPGGGGGGSSWIDYDRCYDTSYSEASNPSDSSTAYAVTTQIKPHGWVKIRWENPDDV